MIDIHSHILPGVDDGAQTLEHSVEMAKAAVEDGIHTIIATPHHQNGKYNNDKHSILHQVGTLNENLKNYDIPLTVLPGQETRIHGDMIDSLQADEILSLTNQGKYIFVEFPSDAVPRYSKQLLFDIQLEGYQPIIVHPERNRQIIQHPSLLYNMVSRGAYTQITAASLTGRFGKNIKKFTHQLIEANLTHLIASDAHNTTSRGFCMTDAYDVLRENYGSSMVYLFAENAAYLVEGEGLAADTPLEIKKKKKLLGLF
ncbi:tyrosine-protein phosphatase [Halobacillus sp. A5]|uniref:tyrosine-protein phosphatase n=1 Tax=Halobacillus sp. A5 TaxID=2880263 RepID=UPI0020A6D859|nr:CpsB/CapC family capsule biosynthesis tyrosine phosphatase [Halobacillus sp. A5]MCP3029517.1 tyrosine protein phosphatase [Halobacillus sp. A5]